MNDADLIRFVLRGQECDPSELASLVTSAGELLGATEAVAYLASYSETQLVPLVSEQAADRRDLSVEGTVAGRAFTSGTPALTPASPEERRRTVWVPLLDAANRVGVLELVVTQLGPDTFPEAVTVGRLLGAILSGRGRFGDVVEFTRRRVPLSVPAELQWSLLPARAYVSPRVQLAASLEPSAQVAGDSFDFAVNGDTVHLAVLDSMGHGLVSGAVSSVALSAYRNARRSLRGLPDTAREIESAVAALTESSRFVTALLGELDTRTGHLRLLSAGHPPPLLLRDGRGTNMEVQPVPPLGLGLAPEELPVVERTLQPADQLLLYTDGVVEARGGRIGGLFSLERLADFVLREAANGLTAAETLRRLNRTILDYQGGRLQDDATTVLVRWDGGTAAR